MLFIQLWHLYVQLMKLNPIIHEDPDTHIASYLCCMHYKTESAKIKSSGVRKKQNGNNNFTSALWARTKNRT
jgi:hypothetical protein